MQTKKSNKVTEEQIKEVIKFKRAGVSHRAIAQGVLGSSTKASTVHHILSRFYYGKEDAVEPVIKSPRIVLFDVESAPAISYHWGRWKVNIGTSQVIQRPYMITWAAKLLGTNFTISNMLPDYEGFEKNPTDDYPIVLSLWKLLDSADIIVGHYVKKFDLAFLNARFVVHGLPPLSPHKVVCTKELASKHFKFEGNSLAELAAHLGVESKDLMTFEDWKNCVQGLGTPAGWNKMLGYNEQDVEVLEQVYLKIRPFDKNHPNVALHYEDEEVRCVVCGSTELDKLDKTAYTLLSSFDSYRCECGHVMRGRKNNRSKVAMANTLINVM